MTVNIHHRPFQVEELFRTEFRTDENEPLFVCQECGAAVALMWTHTQWHNKMADL